MPSIMLFGYALCLRVQTLPNSEAVILLDLSLSQMGDSACSSVSLHTARDSVVVTVTVYLILSPM